MIGKVIVKVISKVIVKVIGKSPIGKCGARALARKRSMPGRTVSMLLRKIKNSFLVLTEVLQEIFDESAYRRFLVRGSLTPSVASYAAFCDEHEKNRARRPRCC